MGGHIGFAGGQIGLHGSQIGWQSSLQPFEQPVQVNAETAKKSNEVKIPSCFLIKDSLWLRSCYTKLKIFLIHYR